MKKRTLLLALFLVSTIVAFVFNRRKSGMMDDELLKERGV